MKTAMHAKRIAGADVERVATPGHVCSRHVTIPSAAKMDAAGVAVSAQAPRSFALVDCASANQPAMDRNAGMTGAKEAAENVQSISGARKVSVSTSLGAVTTNATVRNPAGTAQRIVVPAVETAHVSQSIRRAA